MLLSAAEIDAIAPSPTARMPSMPAPRLGELDQVDLGQERPVRGVVAPEQGGQLLGPVDAGSDGLVQVDEAVDGQVGVRITAEHPDRGRGAGGGPTTDDERGRCPDEPGVVEVSAERRVGDRPVSLPTCRQRGHHQGRDCAAPRGRPARSRRPVEHADQTARGLLVCGDPSGHLENGLLRKVGQQAHHGPIARQHLGEPGAVAQHDKGHVAMLSATVQPARHRHDLVLVVVQLGGQHSQRSHSVFMFR